MWIGDSQMGTVDGKGVQGPHDAAEGVAADQASRCERLWMAPQSKSGILKLRWAQRVCNQVCLARGPALIWGCSGASKRPSPLLCTCFPALVTSRLVKHVGTPPHVALFIYGLGSCTLHPPSTSLPRPCSRVELRCPQYLKTITPCQDNVHKEGGHCSSPVSHW